jgi:hypothetical protein
VVAKNAAVVSGQLAIIRRLIQPRLGNLQPSLARYLLTLHFSEVDQARVDELAQKNQAGTITHPEREELQHYIDAGHFLDWLHAKARLSLKKRNAPPSHG